MPVLPEGISKDLPDKKEEEQAADDLPGNNSLPAKGKSTGISQDTIRQNTNSEAISLFVASRNVKPNDVSRYDIVRNVKQGSVSPFKQPASGKRRDFQGNPDEDTAPKQAAPSLSSILAPQTDADWLELIHYCATYAPEVFSKARAMLTDARRKQVAISLLPSISQQKMAKALRQQDFPGLRRGTPLLYARILCALVADPKADYEQFRAMRSGTSSNTIWGILFRLQERGYLIKIHRELFQITDKVVALMMECMVDE